MRLRWGVRPPYIVLLVVVALWSPYVAVANWPVGGLLSRVSRSQGPVYVFPDGGRHLFPRYRLVALYGTPNTPELGALGRQNVAASIRRVKALARSYQRLLPAIHVLPTMEIITTVASAYPTDDGDYSYAIPATTLQPWITAARQAGVYVVLDLQPGRSSFLHQAQQLQPLLIQPNVGLALDPEWRLKPHELPLQQIGSVSIEEVNATAGWLAALIHRYQLPQKLLVLHQFRLDMLPDRQKLDSSHPELAYIIQMDGQGSQVAKLNTWQAITAGAPKNTHFGWKNFYQEDQSLRSPQDVLKLQPQPWYISYQ